MPFSQVPGKVDFVAQEHRVLDLWRETRAFARQRELHRGQPHWSFIDGPITANNPMGVHHGWGRSYKDLFQRYWTMKGRELRYQNGFDCQGLWVEVEVEKTLGFASKKDIEQYGLAGFVLRCKERVLRSAAMQTEQSMRLGFWMDWNDPEQLRWMAGKLAEDASQVITVQGPNSPVTDTVEQIVGRLGLPELGGSYFTFSNENNYMIWTFLKRCWEHGWLYRGADVMPWCPRCATGISQHEIVTDGYQELTHPAVTVRFPLRDRPGEALLVWTTTPWTLTSNVAAAVGPHLTYVRVRNRGEVFYLSRGTLHMLRAEYTVLEELKGEDLVGWTYDGPFDYLEAAQAPGGLAELRQLLSDVPETAVEAHRIIAWDAVGEEEGTGIVHIAPGCGAEDYQLGKQYHLPVLAPLDEESRFLPGYGWLTGEHVSEVAPRIFEDLERRGLLYRVRDYTHRYPICWRCKTELVFRLVDEWFISMDQLRHQMLEVTRQIKWVPAFGLERELDWLRNMHDWMISKKRYWGLALPIWECAQCHHFEVIGDEVELQARAVAGWETFAGHTPHRPYVDAVQIACPQCGERMSRIADVGNPWLDAGIVSFSTLQYRNDRDYWRAWYPAHWISESFPGQFRNWFYSLLAMATVLENRPPFLENFSYATLFAEDGTPMHKSAGNMIEFNEAADRMGVDVMRWMYALQKPENNLLFGYKRADEVRRQFLIPLWNVYAFFANYARLDGWEPSQEGFDPARPEGAAPNCANLLDRWILARMNAVNARVSAAIEASQPETASAELQGLIDDLSDWYVRRSRRRFWKSEHDDDKNAAYATLYHVLVKTAKMLAPFAPFVTEVIYQNLVRGVQPEAHVSVHHTAWPEPEGYEEGALAAMDLARRIASQGLAARNSVNIKVRQPLTAAIVHVAEGGATLSSAELTEILRDELNVKSVGFATDEGELVTYRLAGEGRLLGPRLGRLYPAVRAALSQADAAAGARRLRAGLGLTLEAGGETFTLAPEEVLIDTQPREGLAVVADRGITVAVDAVLTPDLLAEGLVRDLVRAAQSLRKDADYPMDQRITVGAFDLDGATAAALTQFATYFQQETLCTHTLTVDDGLPWDASGEARIGGATVRLAVRR